jgi:hypothetical protein
MITYSHILAVFFLSNEQERLYGERWYDDAYTICENIALDYALDSHTVAGVIAALSPNNKWARNCQDAENLIRAYTMGGYSDAARIKVSTYNKNKIKALQILSGLEPLEILGGLKVRNFYSCILGNDPAAVCVDGHAYAIWQGERIPATKTPKISPKLYSAIAADYQAAADQINRILNAYYSAAQIQAICWTVWQRIKGEV